MAETSEGVHPTRMELMRIKHKTSLAEKGHRLLREKRDALMMEFMSTARYAEETAEKTVGQLARARESAAAASAIVGLEELGSLSLSSSRRVTAELRHKNVMGVQLPKLAKTRLERKPDEREYSITLVNPAVDEAALQYEKSAERLMELVEVEYSLRALSEETRRTGRRVNALEYNIIPRLKKARKRIEMRLDELERESFYRLKMVKKTMEVD
jgi:V/A-type H+-transporting ATPase subunit D